MGPPGVGKGTQASSIAAHYGIPWVSSGDIFRDNIKRHTPMGERVVEIIGRGDMVPDVLTTALIFNRLIEPDCRGGWLLDGYPRTLPQVDALDLAMQERGTRLDAVLALVADADVLVERMHHRAVIEGRPDDNETTIRHRLDVYRTETEPLADVYRGRDLLVEVDAEGSIHEVRDRIRETLSAKLGR